MVGEPAMPGLSRGGSTYRWARELVSPAQHAPESLSRRELARLRWLALGAQALTIIIAGGVWEVTWPYLPLLALLGLGVLTNLALPRIKTWSSLAVVGVTLLLDVALLTGVLALTGGPANPFSILYLVHVMLGAIATTAPWTWSVVGLSSLGFGLLFFVSVPLPQELGGHAMHAHHGAYSAHLQGMWIAYTLTAAVIAGFVSRLAQALRQERENRSRASQLLSLATLAAGAAHEIGNPLATIRVAASELERELARQGASADVLDDLELIGAEVARVHGVLNRMSQGAGELVGETPTATELAQLLARAVQQLGAAGQRVELHCDRPGQVVQWPVEAASQAIAQILRNAVEASPEGARVRCATRLEADGVEIEIVDVGTGMTEETLERMGEPFFSTKADRGTGLGVFIARSLIDHLHGRIVVQSSWGKGTRVRVWLPLGVG